jgi:type III pantothenate kinase
MLLVVDIGNTHVSIGVYSQRELVGSCRISSNTTRTEDETWFILHSLFESQGLSFDDITGGAISSVVPNQTPVFEQLCIRKLDIKPVVVSSEIKTNMKILYRDPASVGPDRICNAIAGFTKFGGPLIIVDFGTATTFDVVSEQGEYLGGIIAPGLESSSYVLHQHAARLPKVELKFPKSVIGKTTEESMQAGIMFGTVDLVRGLIVRINDELQVSARLIITGGIGSRISGKFQDWNPEVEPNLTLEGLRILHEINI